MAVDFAYQKPFPLGKDATAYRLLTKDFVSESEFEGIRMLKVSAEGLTLLAETAFKDAATSEAIVFGVKAWLDPARMIDVINAGSGRNRASQDKFPRAILPRTFDSASPPTSCTRT